MSVSFVELPTRSVDAKHLLGRIHSFESFGTVDGPGTRFVVFLQGCLFRCKYCHNRDTWDLNEGKLYSVTEMLDEILPYIPFIDASGGGVTVTGGEPLLQKEFICVLFKLLRQQGIHTCLDTNGYVNLRDYGKELDKLFERTNLVLLDLKQIDNDKHILLTEISNEKPLEFARYLNKINQPTWIRHVVVPGYSDDLEDIKRLADFVAPMKNVEKVELLPYHKLGKHKWESYGESYPLEGVEPPSKEKMRQIKEIFNDAGLATQL